MTVKSFPRILNSHDVYREFFGDPGKVKISPKSTGYIDAAMKSVDQWTNDNKYKDGLRFSLGKQAEMGENFGIPTDRMFKGMTLSPHDPSLLPGSVAAYDPEFDTIYVPTPDAPVDAHRKLQDLDEDELKAYLHSLMAHEHDHYMLAHSIGRPFEFDQQRANQLDKKTIGGRSTFFRRPYERGFSLYGAEDFGRAYPSEEIPEISRLIAEKTFQQGSLNMQQRKAIQLKRKMLQSLQKNGIASIPNPSKDLYADIYSTGTVTYADEVKISNRVVQAMKNLAATKEVLRNKLAALQNQNIGLAWLGSFGPGNAQDHDFNLIRDNNALLGITAPAFDNGWDPDAFSQGLHYPVSRNIDPLMHKIAKHDLVDPRDGVNINTCWPTTIGGWDSTLYKQSRL